MKRIRKLNIWSIPGIVGLLFGANLATSAALGQFQYEVLRSFGAASSDVPAWGVNNLTLASDGKLYGTVREGGRNNGGTVFRIETGGTNFQVLHEFGLSAEDGRWPYRQLVEDAEGTLYGLMNLADLTHALFKINKDGSSYVVLHKFSAANDGVWSPNSVIVGSDGMLYGATDGGNQGPSVFALRGDGTSFRVLHSFPNSGMFVQTPHALVEGDDGALYGTTGAWPGGVVFRLTKDGSDFVVLHRFPDADEKVQIPISLLQAGDGWLYGVTISEGPARTGTLFKLARDGSNYTTLYTFSSNLGEGNPNPSGNLIEGGDGALYGTTFAPSSATSDGINLADGVAAVFKVNKDGTGFTILRRFTNLAGEDSPRAFVFHGPDGTLFGTLSGGEAANGEIIFKLSPEETAFTVLHSFFHNDDVGLPVNPLVEAGDGALLGTIGSAIFTLDKDGNNFRQLRSPFFSLANEYLTLHRLFEGSDGALYGTLSFYSDGTNSGRRVFRTEKDGSRYAVLRQFDMPFGAGEPYPNELVEGSDGFLFGTTPVFVDSGTLFKMAKDGTQYAVLHEFGTTNEDGIGPRSLLEGRDGLLYGTTLDGGSVISGTVGKGTLFRIRKDGSDYRVLHYFDLPTGSYPTGPIVAGVEGVIYGTTFYGGVTNATAPFGFGTIFRVNTDGTGYGVLHAFSEDASQGSGVNGVIDGGDGFLYGTSMGGGRITSTSPDGLGTVFRLRKDGSGYEVLHSFAGGRDDGQQPFSVLTRGSDGAFYGTTNSGGRGGAGTILVLRPLVPPPPVMLGVTAMFTAVKGRFASVGGSTNQVLRATTLADQWQVLTNIVAPVNAIAEFADPASRGQSAFYRVLRR